MSNNIIVSEFDFVPPMDNISLTEYFFQQTRKYGDTIAMVIALFN